MTIYTIRAHDTQSTPFEALYGQYQLVHADRAEAEAIRAILTSDPCWGRDGDLVAADVGLSYTVEEEDPRDLEGPWRRQAEALGLVSTEEE